MSDALRRVFAASLLSAFFGFTVSAGAQQPAARTLKMQSSLPASTTLQENFKLLEDLAGDRVR